MSEKETQARLLRLESEFAKLQKDFAALLRVKAGPAGLDGRDGKDGRDGRDGKSTSAKEIATAFVSMMPRARAPIINVESAPVMVNAPASEPAQVFVHLTAPENHVHLTHAQGPHDEAQLKAIESLLDASTELKQVLKMPVKPIYDKAGKIIGGQRVETLEKEM